MSRYPRLGTAAGDRAMSMAQSSYDNMTEEDVYGPDEPEPEEEEEDEAEEESDDDTRPDCPTCQREMMRVGCGFVCRECENELA